MRNLWREVKVGDREAEVGEEEEEKHAVKTEGYYWQNCWALSLEREM